MPPHILRVAAEDDTLLGGCIKVVDSDCAVLAEGTAKLSPRVVVLNARVYMTSLIICCWSIVEARISEGFVEFWRGPVVGGRRLIPQIRIDVVLVL